MLRSIVEFIVTRTSGLLEVGGLPIDGMTHWQHHYPLSRGVCAAFCVVPRLAWLPMVRRNVIPKAQRVLPSGLIP